MHKEWLVQAKRHVLAVLHIQTGRTLFDVFIERPSDRHEELWLDTVYRDMAREQAKRAKHNLPPTPAEMEYQIESIRSYVSFILTSRALITRYSLHFTKSNPERSNFV